MKNRSPSPATSWCAFNVFLSLAGRRGQRQCHPATYSGFPCATVHVDGAVKVDDKQAVAPASGQPSGATPSPVVASVPAAAKLPEFSQDWRVAGQVKFGDQVYVVLASINGRLRYKHPSAFKFTGQAVASSPSSLSSIVRLV